MKKLLIALSLSASALTTNAADYLIDTQGGHASINFKASHLGFSWLIGRFNDFEGNFVWDRENPAGSSIQVSIDTASIDSNHAERDKHLRGDDFLDVSEYPTASFRSTGYTPTGEGTGELTGEFSLHGVTRSMTFPVQHIGEGEDPWGGYRAGFAGNTSIMLGDYGMAGPLGNLEVELELHVEGIRQ